ncbi:glycosyltransferase [Nocardioides lijunqiniae]|uniref:glycosyltransferase n=1 Tax=Nocardioides lijunqiniae TaxID=2760832 RepID=UPI0018781339|nr:glycosyltransferase [Nocardioides lijunqiniae]
MSAALRICLIASSRFPIREPFAGGLEALTFHLARRLVARGHDVSIFAAPGSEPGLPVTDLPLQPFVASEAARSDVGATPEQWLAEHHAYLSLMLDLLAQGRERFDVVHNNSLHHLPIAMAWSLPVPTVTTLHTPPVPWLESAVKLDAGRGAFTAVSAFTSRSWAHATPSTPIHNGVDTDQWSPGPGGGAAIWSGRLVAEKAPHLAIDAARVAGVPLVLAGAAHDPAYFETEIRPRLGRDVEYAGHLTQHELVDLLGAAAVAVVTPAWDEPYGLVAAEAMSCGTPVAAFERGALPEIVGASAGRLARPGDVGDLGRAIAEAVALDRAAVREAALSEFTLDRMVDDYERVYAGLVTGDLAA